MAKKATLDGRLMATDSLVPFLIGSWLFSAKQIRKHYFSQQAREKRAAGHRTEHVRRWNRTEHDASCTGSCYGYEYHLFTREAR